MTETAADTVREAIETHIVGVISGDISQFSRAVAEILGEAFRSAVREFAGGLGRRKLTAADVDSLLSISLRLAAVDSVRNALLEYWALLPDDTITLLSGALGVIESRIHNPESGFSPHFVRFVVATELRFTAAAVQLRRLLADRVAQPRSELARRREWMLGQYQMNHTGVGPVGVARIAGVDYRRLRAWARADDPRYRPGSATDKKIRSIVEKSSAVTLRGHTGTGLPC